jgi:hypothetical protein
MAFTGQVEHWINAETTIRGASTAESQNCWAKTSHGKRDSQQQQLENAWHCQCQKLVHF